MCSNRSLRVSPKLEISNNSEHSNSTRSAGAGRSLDALALSRDIGVTTPVSFQDGLLAAMVLPAVYDRIRVPWINLHEVGLAPLALARDQRGT